MLCERCKRGEAAVLYREVGGGRSRTLWLCRACADTLSAAEELEDISAAAHPFASPLLLPEQPTPLPLTAVAAHAVAAVPRESTSTASAEGESDAAVCSLCGTTASTLLSTGKVGCARCYRTFRASLGGALRALHGNVVHSGRVSAGYRVNQERLRRLETLREALKEAVLTESFEEAVVLRDEIRRVQAEAGGA